MLPKWALPKAPAAPPPSAPINGSTLPKPPEPRTGTELSAWLSNLDSWLADRGYAPAGHLRAEVIRLSGTTEPIEAWPMATVRGSVQIAKGLAAKLRQGGDTPLAQQLRASIAERQGSG